MEPEKKHVIDPSLNEITCGQCKNTSDGYYWGSCRDVDGTDYYTCPFCGCVLVGEIEE